MVWIGGAPGVVSSWSDTQVMASVASSALTGIVKIQQNGTWSNAVTFTVPSGGTTNPVTLVPNVINMVVGGTQPIQALNASSQLVTGLTWTSSDTSVVTLSTDDPPIITAVGVGQATIKAGNASADVTVVASSSLTVGSLPVGTVICSNPGDASGVASIIPAVPSPTGVADVFALQADGNVLAITKDCLTAWSAFVGTGNTLLPDFQGGLVVANGQSIYKLDGMTGQAYPAYTSPASNTLQKPVVHTDGTIFTVDGDKVVGIDPQAGQPRVSVQMDDSTGTFTTIDPGRGGVGACYSSPFPQDSGSTGSNSSSPPTVGNLIVAGDGYAYVPYLYQNSFGVGGVNIPAPVTQLCTSYSTIFTTEYLKLLRVGTSGDSYAFPLGAWSYASSSGPDGFSQSEPLPSIVMSTPITNADTGVLFTWSADTGGSEPPCPPGTLFGSGCTFGNPFHLTTTSGTAVASQATSNMGAGLIQPMLQRADGSYVGTDGTNMFAFTTSGTQLWTVPNDTPQIGTSDGGAIGASGITYDRNGNANGQTQLPNPNPTRTQGSLAQGGGRIGWECLTR